MSTETSRRFWRALSYVSFGLGGICTVVALWHLYLLGTEPGVRTDVRAKVGAAFVVAAIVLVGLGALSASRGRADQEV